jgi:hypothetical protein
MWLFSCIQTPFDSGISEEKEEPLSFEQYSVIVLADPHVSQVGEHQERLQRTVEWINTHREEEDIRLVFILGDVGWGEGLQLAHDTLKDLTVPHVPVIGDNEVHFGDEMRFFSVFSDVFNSAAEWSTDWHDSFSTVWNPELEQDSTFGNFSFSFEGIRYIGLDWASRHSGSILGEMGDTHPFEGGTLPWLTQELSYLSSDHEPIFFVSHIPMYMNAGAFDIYEMEEVEGLVSAYSDRIHTNFAGHYHSDSEHSLDYYDLVVVDAIWDDEIRFQKLNIQKLGREYSFSRELVTIE